MENRLKGTTLVELLLYLALFTMVIGTMVQFFILVINRNITAKHNIELSSNALFINQTLNGLEDRVNSINFSTSTTGVPNGRLVLNTTDGELVVFVQNSTLYISDNGQNIRLSNPSVVVNSFTLSDILNQSNIVIGYNINLSLSHQLLDNSNIDFDYVFSVN